MEGNLPPAPVGTYFQNPVLERVAKERTTQELQPPLRSQQKRHHPPTWKIFLLTLVPAYLASTAIIQFFFMVLPKWPFVVINALVTLLLVAFLSYGAIPLGTRLFNNWLYALPKPGEHPARRSMRSAGLHPLSLQLLNRRRRKNMLAMDGLHEQNSVQVIARAADILRMLSEQPEGLSLSQIAQRVSLPKSTVGRIVGALETEHLVLSSPHGIRLGPGLLRLAAEVSRSLRQQMRPIMEHLSQQTNETVCLAVWNGENLLCIDVLSGLQRLFKQARRSGNTSPFPLLPRGKRFWRPFYQHQLSSSFLSTSSR